MSSLTVLRTALVVAWLTGAPHAQPAITASDAWMTESQEGTAAAYLTVTNPTMYDIYLVSATSEAAGKIDFREGEKTVKEITVPSFGWLEMKPGGASLRLSEVPRQLKAGERVALTVMTDGGITLVATAVVRAR